jgi:hypothetical protein
VELRPTTEDDLPALHTTFLAATGELFRRHAFDPPAPPRAAFAAIQRHILGTGDSVVAVEHGRVHGFASAFTRGGDWFLASLFVVPEVQRAGSGPRSSTRSGARRIGGGRSPTRSSRCRTRSTPCAV